MTAGVAVALVLIGALTYRNVRSSLTTLRADLEGLRATQHEGPRVGEILTDTKARFLWEEAERGVAQQAARLDEVRGRVAAIFGAASIAAGFLGDRAFAPHDPSGWAWAAAGFFAGVGLLSTLALFPVSGWRFNRSPEKLMPFLDRYDEPQMLKELAMILGHNYKSNERLLSVLYWATAGSCLLVVAEIVAFLLAIAAG